MNGLFWLLMFVYGKIVISMYMVSMQNNRMCVGMVLMVFGMILLGFCVLLLVMLMILILLYVNIIMVNDVMRLFMLCGRKLLCDQRLFKFDVCLLFIFILRNRMMVLLMIMVLIVMILMSVSQNFILLNILMLQRFRLQMSMMMLSIQIYCGILGNQKFMQMLKVVMLVRQMIIILRMYVQLVRKLVSGLRLLCVQCLNELEIGWCIVILLSVCMIMQMVVLLMMYVRIMVGLVSWMVDVELQKRFVLMVELSVRKWICCVCRLC